MSFPSLDEVHLILDEISSEIPRDFYEGLNGGIILEEGLKYHRESRDTRPLYVLGEYINDLVGRRIKIYYGSFKEAYKYETRSYIYDRLRHTLVHEFTHHLEGRAGLRDLVVEDEENIRKYREDL